MAAVHDLRAANERIRFDSQLQPPSPPPRCRRCQCRHGITKRRLLRFVERVARTVPVAVVTCRVMWLLPAQLEAPSAADRRASPDRPGDSPAAAGRPLRGSVSPPASDPAPTAFPHPASRSALRSSGSRELFSFASFCAFPYHSPLPLFSHFFFRGTLGRLLHLFTVGSPPLAKLEIMRRQQPSQRRSTLDCGRGALQRRPSLLPPSFIKAAASVCEAITAQKPGESLTRCL